MARTSYSGGIGFLGGLTLLFITLKLTGHITWSWFWVLGPVLIFPAIIAVIVGGGITLLVLATIVKWCIEKKPEEEPVPGDSMSKTHRVLKNIKP